ncbi:MAG TPA: phage integrase N-terminal SAM-like domain-containing protein, partial [Pyrinomonadaceae bacterium]|nr:phage integrase N-terminal SAM-like domain-containing protein [Pyrinomonadaceae bacterium]
MTTTLPVEASKHIGVKPRLLDEARAVARMRHLSIRTEQAYVQWIRRFIRFHQKCHPREMGEA